MFETIETSLYLIKFDDGGGITWFDLALVTLCPIGAVIGTLVAARVEFRATIRELAMSSLNHGTPYPDTNDFAHHNKTLGTGSILIGAALGLVLAMYFVGAINQDLTSVARVVGLSILLGYQAPNIWNSQEKIISKIIDRKLQVIIEQKKNDSEI